MIPSFEELMKGKIKICEGHNDGYMTWVAKSHYMGEIQKEGRNTLAHRREHMHTSMHACTRAPTHARTHARREVGRWEGMWEGKVGRQVGGIGVQVWR